MLDELYNSHKFNIDIFSYSSSINLGTGYEAFTKIIHNPLKILNVTKRNNIVTICFLHVISFER